MSRLSRIPLPYLRGGITIREHDTVYPDAPGCTTGFVYRDEGRCTVQCAVCLRTATARDPLTLVILGHWNFAPDNDDEYHTYRHTTYRRCPDCRAKKRHPSTTGRATR